MYEKLNGHFKFFCSNFLNETMLACFNILGHLNNWIKRHLIWRFKKFNQNWQIPNFIQPQNSIIYWTFRGTAHRTFIKLKMISKINSEKKSPFHFHHPRRVHRITKNSSNFLQLHFIHLIYLSKAISRALFFWQHFTLGSSSVHTCAICMSEFLKLAFFFLFNQQIALLQH